MSGTYLFQPLSLFPRALRVLVLQELELPNVLNCDSSAGWLINDTI